ncbi:MAG TPA: alpha-galactosidase [Chitinophagaceae bacterium]|nr:alpha-galactosidase [Chitinophagaceae bacterium]
MPLVFIAVIAAAQTDSLEIANSKVSRKFYFRKDSAGFFTKEFINKIAAQNYANPNTEEFNITINGLLLSGKNCRYISHASSQSGDTTALAVKLQTPLQNVYVQLVYKMYGNIPLVRKYLSVINEGTAELQLTNPDVENMNFQVVDKYMNEVYANYGSHLTRLPYKSDYNDAAVMVFNLWAKQGVIFGNEAPSVLKNTEIYSSKHGRIQLGMRHINETFPFKKYLQPGETFTSPGVFIYVFNSGKWQDGFEGAYKDFTREYLGVSLYKRAVKPLFMYNTWQPFLDDINEKLMMDCADKLENTGTDLFIIDAGWYKRSGDFKADSAKFPHGMKPVCDYIRSKGMQPGLWIGIASVNEISDIAKQHPEWLVKDKDGKIANLHDMSYDTTRDGWASRLKTMSLGSPYYDYIKNLIVNYVKELQLSYVKLDLSIANSAYVHDSERTGDYETNASKLYKDRASSYYTTYERMLQLMDELHAQFPQLLIDCTFEVWGRYNICDYALIEHADYDWLTNFDFEPPVGPISIRQMNYDRSRAIPVNTMLIGNQQVNFSNYQYVYFSLASSSLIMVGDPRKITAEQQAFYKKWNAYFKQADSKYHYTQYLQAYDIFDRATDNNWDGCYRINTEMQGGLMFFYRNNSPDAERSFKISFLEPDSRYKIYDYSKNKIIGTYTGKQLTKQGLKIKIPTVYTALVLEIEKAD